MARPLRIEFPGAFYHATSRGNEKKEIFLTPRDRLRFLSYLDSATTRYGAAIHAYCLMNNHYHLFLETPRGNLSQIMHFINGAYTAYFNTKMERAGHLFQGRYKALIVEADAYALVLSRYIHLNPVRAGIVKTPCEYRWSSFAAYGGLEIGPDWLKTEMILSYFRGNQDEKKMQYRAYTEKALQGGSLDPLANAVSSTILGTQSFVDDITSKYLPNPSVDKDVPAARNLRKRPNFAEIVETVGNVFGHNSKTARRASLYFCHRYSGASLRLIGDHFSMKETAVSMVSKRFAHRLMSDSTLAEKTRTVAALIKA